MTVTGLRARGKLRNQIPAGGRWFRKLFFSFLSFLSFHSFFASDAAKQTIQNKQAKKKIEQKQTRKAPPRSGPNAQRAGEESSILFLPEAGGLHKLTDTKRSKRPTKLTPT